MKEILIFGRGGQGNVTAAELLALAAFEDGQFTQAFPAFGAERTGAPVRAFVRIDNKVIKRRTQVAQPDIMVIQDETLLAIDRVVSSIKPGGIIIASSHRRPEELGLKTSARVFTLPARDIALEVVGRPIVNAIMLGAFAAVTGEVSLEAIQRATRHRFPGTVGERNAEAAKRAYDFMKRSYSL